MAFQRRLDKDGLATTWSQATWEGKRGEDRIVATRREWPTGEEGPELEPPAGLTQSSWTSASTSRLSNTLQAATGGRQRQQQQQMRPSYHLFAAFDGHNGADAARFAEHSIVPIVESFLPPWGQPAFPVDPAELAAQLQEALVLSFLELQRQFAMTGCTGGCTATVVLQVGRLVTVAGVGSSRCLLDTGCDELELTESHVIRANLAERQRLLSAGCLVAAMDVSGSGPAASPCRGSGVLRLWPGGLTLSRAIGDFKIGEAVLPLPHVKQVLLPPSGGRLVLATDGVWGQAGEVLLEVMHTAPLKTAAHEVIKAITCGRSSHSDASIIVADVAPRGDSFQAVCKRQQAAEAAPQAPASPAARLQKGMRGGHKTMMKLLGLGRSKSTVADEQQQQQQQQQRTTPPASAKLLADFDSARLLGLAPPLSAAASAASSRSSTWSRASRASVAESLAEAAAAAAAAAGAATRFPAWFDEQVRLQLEAMREEAWQLWHLARRRQAAAELAAFSEADVMERGTSRSETDLVWLEAAAAAMVAAAEEVADGAPATAFAAAPAAAAAPAGPGAQQPEAAAGPASALLQQAQEPTLPAAPLPPPPVARASSMGAAPAPASPMGPPRVASTSSNRSLSAALEAIREATAAAEGESPFEEQPPASQLAVPAELADAMLSPHAPAVLRSNSLAATAGSSGAGSGSAGANRLDGGGATAPARLLRKQRSLPPPASRGSSYGRLAPLPPTPASKPNRYSGIPASDSDSAEDDAKSDSAETVLSDATMLSAGGGDGDGTRRVSFAGAGGGQAHHSLPIDPLATPRRRLPPLRKLHSQPASSMDTGSGGGAGAGGGTHARLPRISSTSNRSSTTLLCGGGGGSSAWAVGPSTPRASLDQEPETQRPPRRRAPGELVGSPNTKWMTAYSLTAGMFTKAGSGYHTRQMQPAAGMDSWIDAFSHTADAFTTGAHRRSRSTGGAFRAD